MCLQFWSLKTGYLRIVLFSEQERTLTRGFLIVPFDNDFPLAVNSLNNVNKLILYNNQLIVVEQYFTNFAATQNVGVS